MQYIHPGDAHKLEQAELVCIDEAAAIPLPLVKRLIGPYLVLMASTVNGWVRVHVRLALMILKCCSMLAMRELAALCLSSSLTAYVSRVQRVLREAEFFERFL